MSGAAATTTTAAAQSDGPHVEIVGAPQGPIEPGESNTIGAEYDADGPFEFEWDHGNGTTDDGYYTTVTYDEPGTYDVTVTLTTDDGQSDSDQIEVEVASSAPVAQISMEFVDQDGYEQHRNNLALENPELLARDDVDRIEIEHRSSFFNEIDSVTGFVEGEERRTYVLEEPVEEATMAIDVDDNAVWSDELEDGAIMQSHGFPDVSIVSDDPDADVRLLPEVAGEGLALPSEILYIGKLDTASVETEHGPLTIAFPDELEVSAALQQIADGSAEFSEWIDIGTEYAGIAGFALPTDTHDDAAGKASGTKPRFYAQDNSSFEIVGSTWLHELAHVVEDLDDDGDTDWLTEAFATYYAALGPVEMEHGPYDTDVYEGIHYSQFRREMDEGVGEEGDLRDESLVDDTEFDYDYGSLVLGSIDREIRAATDDATLEDVFEGLHAVEGDLSHDDVLDQIESVVAEQADADDAASIRQQADDWITAEEHAEPWTAREHEAAFGYGVTAFDDLAVTGVVDGERRYLDEDSLERIDVGEPVKLEVTLLHPDSSEGTVTVELVDDGNPADSTTIERQEVTETGDEVTTELQHEFQETVWTELEADVEISGAFGGSLRDADLDQRVVAMEPDATLVTARDDTTEDDPVTATAGEELALLLDTWWNSSAEVTLTPVDETAGSDEISVQVGDNLHLCLTHADELDPGVTYAVEFPHPDDETQYVEVEATDQTEPDEEPHGEISPSTTTASVGEAIGFDIETNEDWLTDRQWDMDDGTTYDGDWHVSHAFDAPGTYTVRLETESGHDGSRTTDAVEVTITE